MVAEEAFSDDFLDSFETALAEGISSTPVLHQGPVEPDFALLGTGTLYWPVEIRRGIAGYLPWREIIADARVCKTWRALAQDTPLWWTLFRLTWPLHALRQAARAAGPQDWPELFRSRWQRGEVDGDGDAEDWLDLFATQPSNSTCEAAGSDHLVNDPDRLQQALKSFRAALLQTRGICMPEGCDGAHWCDSGCCFHKLPDATDAFVCESSGVVHQCSRGRPCGMCVVSSDGCFLVCPASGMSYERLNYIDEEAAEDVEVWDPGISELEQVSRWFEEGYNMSEEQATAAFGSRDR